MIEHSHNTSMSPDEVIRKRQQPAISQPPMYVQIRKVVSQPNCDACAKRSPIHKVCQKHFEELR